MIHKVGLLPAHNVSQVQFAYEFYKDDSQEGWQQSHDFKKTFSIDINVHFVSRRRSSIRERPLTHKLRLVSLIP